MGKRKEKEQNLFYEPMDDAERFQHKEKKKPIHYRDLLDVIFARSTSSMLFKQVIHKLIIIITSTFNTCT